MSSSLYSNQAIIDTFWLDTVDIYRQLLSDKPTTPGDNWPYRLIYSGIQCCLEDTPNFDSPRAGIGQAKTENVFTANELRLPKDTDIKPEDMVLIHIRDGTTEWERVRGFKQERRILEYGSALVTISTPPNIIT